MKPSILAQRIAVAALTSGLVVSSQIGQSTPHEDHAPLISSPLVLAQTQAPSPTPPLPELPYDPPPTFASFRGGFATEAVPTSVVAGRIQATFAVSSSGASTYSVPLWSPPGIGTLQLDLSLNYNSRSGNGVLGHGWALGGLSTITRCNRSWAQDGAPAPVTLTSSDRFCLDGAQLKLTGAIGYGQPNSTYATELDTFSRVTASPGVIGNGPASFTVVTKNGLVFKYGTTADSQILAGTSGTVRTWALSQIADRVGNTINLTYVNDTANGSFRISEITYPFTASGQGPFYKVVFSYGARLGSGAAATSDVPSGYLTGFPTREPNQLNTITMQLFSGAVIKTYNFTYAQGTASRRLQLRTVQECSAANCFPATSITYQDGSAGWSTSVNNTGASSTGGPLGATPLDLDDDGRSDILYPVLTSGTYRWWAVFSTGTGYAAPLNTGLITNSNGIGQIITGMFSGRGPQQFIAPQNTAQGMRWFVFTCAPGGCANANTNVPVAGEFQAADVNGDGLPDLISTVGSNIHVRFNTTTPTGAVQFAASSTLAWTPPTGGGGSAFGIALPGPAPSMVTAADFNGDDRADLLLQFVSPPNQFTGSTQSLVALISNGNGTFTGSPAFAQADFLFPPVPSPILTDWNGDGCTDVLAPPNGGNGWRIHLSTCVGTFVSGAHMPGTPQVIAVDWDADGRSDLLYNDGGTWGVYRSTGDGVAPLTTVSVPAPTTTNWFALDQNGDGLTDLGFVDGNQSNAIKYELHHGANTPPDLATAFTDGFGMSQSPTYVSIVANNYTKHTDAVFPESDFKSPLYVVDQFTASTGTGTTFQNQFWYYGARVHQQGRGFEGFHQRRTLDSRNGQYTYETYARTFPYTGMVLNRSIVQGSSPTLYTWDGTNVSTQVTGGSGFEQRFFPFYASTVEERRESGGTLNGQAITRTTTSYTYGDGFGNPTQVQTSVLDLDPGSPFSGQTWQTTVTTGYLNDTTDWCLGLATSASVQNVVPGQTTRTRSYSSTPDANHSYCRIQQDSIEPGTPALNVTASYLFDSCGNTRQVDVVGRNPDGTAMQTRSTQYNFSHFTPRCQFPESVTNPLGQMSTVAYTYDFGLPLESTDPNGIALRATYDDFGRPLSETRPDGTYSTYSYFYCNTAPCWGVNDLRFSVYRNDYGSDSAPTGAQGFYWDGHNRLRYDQSLLAFGALVYSRIIGYDALGRVSFMYQPVSTGSNGYTQYGYDALNRVTSMTLRQPSGAFDRSIGYAYSGRSTTVTDPLGANSTRIIDVAGRLRRLVDPSPGGTTSYDYDAFGNLNRIADPIGAIYSRTYNLRGFPTQKVDPDAGTWNFTPNSLNELVSWQDAKGQSFSAAYDRLGRMTSRTEPEGVSTFTFGTSAAAHNIGRLQALSGYGYSESLTYDAIGRLSARSITSDQTYHYDYTYNTAGLTDTITYPTSPAPTGTTATRFKIKYTYSFGVPTQIQDITQATPATVWTLNTVNDFGSATSETLGANVVSVSTGYKQWTNERISTQAGVSGSTTNRQNLAYQWDQNGNMKQRQDLAQNLTEIFTYDNLNRPTSSTLNGVQNFTAGYNAAGNLTSRLGVGSYTYGDASKPHGATAAGSNTYSHDANGNVTTRNGQTQTWASYNLPTVLRANVGGTTFQSTFSYGPTHARWRQVATYSNGTETTLYVGGLLEKMTASSTGVTWYKHYIPLPSGLTAIVARKSDATSATTYVLSDHLGSSDALIDGTAGNLGALIYRQSFGAFGERRLSNWSAGTPSTADWASIARTTRRAFTFHEALDNIGLTHMNGRVYDPAVGRFLASDPLNGDRLRSQSLNPYAYASNAPLTFTDPSGLQDTGPSCGYICAIYNIYSYFRTFKKLFGFGGKELPPPANTLPGQSAQTAVNYCTAPGTLSSACNGQAPIQQSASNIEAACAGMDIQLCTGMPPGSGMVNTVYAVRVTCMGTPQQCGSESIWRDTMVGRFVSSMLGDPVAKFNDGQNPISGVWLTPREQFDAFGLTVATAGIPIARAAAPLRGAVQTMDTSLIRFTHSRIKSTLSTGENINDLAEKLRGPGGDALAANFEPIHIFERGGRLYTLDNRRLLTFSMAGRQVPYVWASEAEVARSGWKMTATVEQLDGWYIRVK